ncbi:hypothetical protein BV20DRAFT_1039870 [Pilatotrama ljubarskyi]|nr:hypothetical protein BV20DRAFT_1039870 [Pilatotrama ljubarskyi]
MSVIGDRGTKKLEKLMAQEAKAEKKNIAHALKDVKKAEKAVKKSVKAVEKAQKGREKTVKKEQSAEKALIKAKHKHADALEGEVNAETTVNLRREKEGERDRGVQQAQQDLDSFQSTMEANARDRVSRLAEVLAHFGQEDEHVPSSAELASRL